MQATESAVAVVQAREEVLAYADDWAGLQRLRVLDDGPCGLRVSAPAGVLRREGRPQLVRAGDGTTGVVAEVVDLQRIGGADLAELRPVRTYDLGAPRLPAEPIANGTMVIVGVGRDAIPVELPVRLLEAADGAIVFTAHDGFEPADQLLLRDADVELTVIVLHAVSGPHGRGRYGGRIIAIDQLSHR